jgi:hypothetical protein
MWEDRKKQELKEAVIGDRCSAARNLRYRLADHNITGTKKGELF